MVNFSKKLLILLALVTMIPGVAFSLTNESPSGDVTLESGQSQTFSVQRSYRNSWVVWRLDGAEVAGDTSQYTYTAEDVSSTETHTISVTEYVRLWWWTRTVDEENWDVTVEAGTTPDPEPDPEPDPTSSCVVNYVIGSDWGSGFVANVEITNNSSDTIRGWELEWSFDGNQHIVGGWNADIDQDGQSVSASNDFYSWNGKIYANGGKASFGFQGTYSGANAVPAVFTLNGVACNETPGPTPDPDPDTYYQDADGDGYGNPAVSVSGQQDGYVLDSSDCNDTNASVNPGATEVCNDIDDNCNGSIDEGVTNTYYRDADGDGYGTSSSTIQACSIPSGYTDNSNDCNDSNSSINPGAAEISCDGIDQNCDGVDSCSSNYYRDADGDGYGNSSDMVVGQQDGYVLDSSDCNDTNASVNPGASEVCNGIDDNCNGSIDEGVTNTYYRDADGDGYGTSGQTIQSCSMPSGYADNSNDCNDSDSGINPGATEIECDGIDQNCDGADYCTSNYYRDADGDGYGDPGDVVSGPQNGYVLDGSDCNDTNASVNPGATEVCNEIDDNCNGSIDEGVANTYYRDADGDGYGTSSSTIQACSVPSGYVEGSSDCNDSNSAVNPGAQEACNGIDDNCNGLVDDEESGVVCTVIPEAPANVSASDLVATGVTVTWSASDGADYYRVYRAAWSSAGNYEQVSGNVTGTSFTYTENWSDTANQIGGVPASYFLTSDADSGAFAAVFDSWVAGAFPAMIEFKAPGYFQVDACNDSGCSGLSSADSGQALLTHTSSSSEVAELVLPVVSYPVIRALSTTPREKVLQAVQWCGMDLCGNIEGMVLARNVISSDYSTAQVDVYFENYTVGSNASSIANMVLNGYIGGQQTVADLTAGTLRCSGDVSILLPSGETVAVSCYMEITTSGNIGIADVTYNGNTYRFNMPVQPVSGSTGTAETISSTTSAMTQLNDTSNPKPAPIANASCVTLDPEGPVKDCIRIE